MISPAFSMITVSPMRMSLRRTSPRLWSEACWTVVPATKTGSMLARGVSLPDLADLPIDAEQFRDGLLGGVFVGDAPAREFAGVAELLLQIVRGRRGRRRRRRRRGASPRSASKSSITRQTASIVSHFLVSGFVGMPQAASGVEEFAVGGEAARRVTSPRPWATNCRRRSATMRGSSCLSVPAVALRGLANGSSPAATNARVDALELGGRHVDFAADFEDGGDRDTSCARGARAARRGSCGRFA